MRTTCFRWAAHSCDVLCLVGWPAGNEMSPSRVTLPAYQGNTYVGRGYTSAGIIGRVVMDGWHMWLPATEL